MENDLGTAAVEEIRELWQVDNQWSVDEDRGFSWWGKDYRQRIWSDPGFDEEGIEIFRLHSETDFIHAVDLSEQVVWNRLGTFNRFASVSAMIFQSEANTIRLRSSVFLHRGTASWIPHTFSTTAIIQPIEAQIRAEQFAELLGGKPEITAHPSSGPRSTMDDMLNVVEAVYAPLGQREPPWAETDEFEETAAFFNKSNSFATADKSGLTAEFAWGEDQTSMMTAELGQPHPQLGKGVLVRLNLPLTLDSDDAALLAGYLNQLEIKSLTRAHLLGAWSTDKVSGSHTVVFASFIPNVMYKPGLLTQMLMTMGLRLRWVATVVEPGLEPGSVIDIVSQRYFGVR